MTHDPSIPDAPRPPQDGQGQQPPAAPQYGQGQQPSPAPTYSAPASAAPTDATQGAAQGAAPAPAGPGRSGSRALSTMSLIVLALAVIVAVIRLVYALIDLAGAGAMVEQLMNNDNTLYYLSSALGIIGWVLGIVLLLVTVLLTKRTNNVLKIGTGMITVSLVLMFLANRIINRVSNSTLGNAGSADDVVSALHTAGIIELLLSLVLGGVMVAGALLNVRQARQLERTAH